MPIVRRQKTHTPLERGNALPPPLKEVAAKNTVAGPAAEANKTSGTPNLPPNLTPNLTPDLASNEIKATLGDTTRAATREKKSAGTRGAVAALGASPTRPKGGVTGWKKVVLAAMIGLTALTLAGCGGSDVDPGAPGGARTAIEQVQDVEQGRPARTALDLQIEQLSGGQGGIAERVPGGGAPGGKAARAPTDLQGGAGQQVQAQQLDAQQLEAQQIEAQQIEAQPNNGAKAARGEVDVDVSRADAAGGGNVVTPAGSGNSISFQSGSANPNK